MNKEKNYDLIVIGCGFCGSVIARLAAEECGKKVLILERRGHIAGNMYDERDEDGFIIQKYGPHVFHTDEDWIYDYIKRFAKWKSYKVLYGVELDNKCVPAPFGFQAIRMLYSPNEAKILIEKLKRYYAGEKSIPVLDLLDCQDKMISDFAEMIYEKNYKPYAAKQWNLDPKELDRSVIARMPIILSERKNYFDVKYELLPEEGFTNFFRQMLTHCNIEIKLNVDAKEFISFDFDKGVCTTANGVPISIPIVYTGALDDIMQGDKKLAYRSLYFEYKKFDVDSYQPVTILTYPQAHQYLRTTEFSKMMEVKNKGRTVVSFEYPVLYNREAERGNEPYYPILTKENLQVQRHYLKKKEKIKNLILCGRLADYKYYNMDQAIMRAFEVFSVIKEQYWRIL